MKNIRVIVFCMILVLSFFAVSCSDSNNREEDTTIPVTEEPAETIKEIQFADETENGVNVYRVKTFSDRDGIDWYAVPAAAIDTYKWVGCDEPEAYAQLVYVDGYGFICRMTAIESEPFSRFTEYGDPSCLDSCLEFFISLDGEKYINIEANSIGALYVGIGSSRDDHTPAHELLSTEEMITVTPTVEDDKWHIMIDLPHDKLQKLYGKEVAIETFSSGYTFGGNFYKTESADNGNEHYGMWNEVKSEMADFHRPEFFGKFIME